MDSPDPAPEAGPIRLIFDAPVGARDILGGLKLTGTWAGPEGTHRWAIAPSVQISFPRPATRNALAVLIELTPAIEPPAVPSRLLRIRLGDRIELDVRTRRTETFLIPVPQEAGDTIDLVFRFDNVALAGDRRRLAFAFNRVVLFELPIVSDFRRTSAGSIASPGDFVRTVAAAEAATGVPVDHLLMEFESLGQTCDFGFLQRRCGIEPIGLLRFAGIDLAALVRGLLYRFDGLGDPGSAELTLLPGAGREYFLRERRYGIGSHTFMDEGAVLADQLLAKEPNRLAFLGRHFLEAVDNAEKTFILRHPESLHIAQVEAVASALRLTSDSRLLWVVQGMGGEPGSVDVFSPYLMRGHLDQPGEPGSSSPEAWLSICANAYMLRNAAHA